MHQAVRPMPDALTKELASIAQKSDAESGTELDRGKRIEYYLTALKTLIKCSVVCDDTICHHCNGTTLFKAVENRLRIN